MTPKKTTVRVYLARDAYGIVKWAGTSKAEAPAEIMGAEIRWRLIESTRDLVRAMIQTGTSTELFAVAWRHAVGSGSVAPRRWFREGDSWGSVWGAEIIAQARRDAEIVEGEISAMVNNPNSKFYIHG